jgi:hypothetical protein
LSGADVYRVLTTASANYNDALACRQLAVIAPYLGFLVIAAMLLRFGRKNHFSTEQPPVGLFRQLLIISGGTVAFFMLCSSLSLWALNL